ncbi:MAG: DUF6629 family protein [Sediminibacterium sp.]
MCFSATASFIAGGALSTVGVATLKKTEKKSEIPFASIPLLFGIQQIIEGVIWLTFHRHAPEINIAMTFIYSVFSHVLWPIFVPLSIMLLETVSWRKKVMFTLWIAGTIVGLYLFYNLFAFPITSRVDNNHIVYFSPHFYIYTVMGFYVAATCVSSMFSSHKMIKIFGVLALAAFIFSYLFYKISLVSVWCFFAAILSIMIYAYFNYKNVDGTIQNNLNNAI